jgi:hypothetical protein
MITKETIQECHHPANSGRIDDLVNFGKGEIVLRTIFVQVGEVGAHSPIFILFLNHHHICWPPRVGYFPDETYVQ